MSIDLNTLLITFKSIVQEHVAPLAERIITLEGENKALGDLLSDAGEQIATLVVTNSALVERMTQFEDGTSDTLSVMGETIKSITDVDNADRTALMSRVTALEKDDTLSQRMIGLEADAKRLDDVTLTVNETAKVVLGLKSWQKTQNVTDTVRSLWDEELKNDVASMIPDLDEHDAQLDKRFESVTEQMTIQNDRFDWFHDRINEVTKMKGPAGADGADGTDGIDAINGIDGINGINGINGERGTDGVDGVDGTDGVDGKSIALSDVVDIVLKSPLLDQMVEKHIPEAIVGPAGADGKDGLGHAGPAGQDADHDVVIGQVLDRILKGLPDLVRDAMPDAPKALMPTDLQVIEAVKAVYPSIRQDLVKRLPAMEHKGPWTPDVQYDVGDEVIKNGSTYRLMEPSTDQPPNEAWKMISQGRPGKQGKPGIDGPQGLVGTAGKDGISVTDIIMADSTLVMELSDGTVKTFDLTEFIELIIKAIGE